MGFAPAQGGGGSGDTELPTAAALADNAANPTAPLVGACVLGFDGTTWDRVTNGGGVEATSLRVTLANDSTGLVSVDDNAGSLTVDNATLSVTGGGTEATSIRVTIANDSTGLVSVDDNAGSLTVDNAALSVTGGGVEASALRVTIANDSTGVVSVDDNAGSLTVDNAALSVTGGGAEATAMRVTIANDSTGLVSVDDNGGNLSVDWAGTVPPIGAGLEATALRVTVATDSTGVLSVDDNAGSLTVDNAALSVTGGGVEASALRVTIANDSTGLVSVDDNAGSLTVDNAALSVTGGGAEATALRVTIANDSTGVLSVDDNAGSLTIDGTVTANAGTGTFTVDSELPAAAALADGATNPTTPLVGSCPSTYNGTTWDRYRGVAEVTAIASATYDDNVTKNGSDLTNYNAKGIIIVFDTTSWTAGGNGTTIGLQIKGTGSAGYVTLKTFSFAAPAATGPQATFIFPTAGEAASWASTPMNGIVPRVFRITAQVATGAPNFVATCYVQFVN